MCFQGRWSLSVQGQFQLERLEREDAFGKGESGLAESRVLSLQVDGRR